MAAQKREACGELSENVTADPVSDRAEEQTAGGIAVARDTQRCRRVEDALYRRACGYKVKLKKSFKLKRVDYDPDTGKKLSEQEVLEAGFEEVHIPADIRVCAYYLNNRDPARWREHPREEGEEALCGVVDYPPLEELTPPPEDGEGGAL
jgi:hypothetical protein